MRVWKCSMVSFWHFCFHTFFPCNNFVCKSVMNTRRVGRVYDFWKSLWDLNKLWTFFSQSVSKRKWWLCVTQRLNDIPQQLYIKRLQTKSLCRPLKEDSRQCARSACTRPARYLRPSRHFSSWRHWDRVRTVCVPSRCELPSSKAPPPRCLHTATPEQCKHRGDGRQRLVKSSTLNDL